MHWWSYTCLRVTSFQLSFPRESDFQNVIHVVVAMLDQNYFEKKSHLGDIYYCKKFHEHPTYCYYNRIFHDCVHLVSINHYSKFHSDLANLPFKTLQFLTWPPLKPFWMKKTPEFEPDTFWYSHVTNTDHSSSQIWLQSVSPVTMSTTPKISKTHLM